MQSTLICQDLWTFLCHFRQTSLQYSPVNWVMCERHTDELVLQSFGRRLKLVETVLLSAMQRMLAFWVEIMGCVLFKHKCFCFTRSGNVRIRSGFGDLWNALHVLNMIMKLGERSNVSNWPVSHKCFLLLAHLQRPFWTTYLTLQKSVCTQEPAGKQGDGTVCVCAHLAETAPSGLSAFPLWSPACADGIDWVSDCLQSASVSLLCFTAQEQPEDNENKPPEVHFYSLTPLLMPNSECWFWIHKPILGNNANIVIP